MTPIICDKLDQLIALSVLGCAKDDVEMFKALDDSDVVLDERFRRRYQNTVRRAMWKSRRAIVTRVVSRAAVVVLAIFSAAFISIMSISALREAVWRIITEWYEDYVVLTFDKGNSETTDVSEATVSGVTADTVAPSDTPPTLIEAVRKPTALPEGAQEEIVRQSKLVVMIDYYLGDDWIGTYRQLILNKDNEVHVDNSEVVIQALKINGFDAVILLSELDKTLYWSDGEYIYLLVSTLDVSAMVMMAESVR